MPLETSYSSQGAAPAAIGGAAETKDEGYWSLGKLRKCYTDYLFSKRQEQDEAIDSRRYYHGSQWTTEQINVMKKRRQPVMTFNRVARKIDGVVGLIEKLKQDPKAYARTPQHEQGADLATATLRYVMDEQDWNAKSPEGAQDGAVDGIGGIEINIEQGDQGDPEVAMEMVDIQSFFYDPRSYKADFSDARFMGVGKWLDKDVAEEMFPDAELDVAGNDFELTTQSDRETRWFQVEGPVTRIRVVDIWYKHKGGWCYTLFTGSKKLMEDRAYLKDEKGKDMCKYIMFSGNVDQDGDRYGFVRNMKSAQDGINAKQSKMQHILASNRLFITRSSVDDVERTRAEYARNDGLILVNGQSVTDGVKSDDRSIDFAGWEKMLELNLAEIENFGPNPALIGTGVNAKSGRAISLMQQAGMAELGPYIAAFRGWKIRVYRAVWNAVQQHWKAERWIRVTDDQDLAQYIQINGMQTDPNTGMPSMVNPIGSLDVDIILDEGPDTITVMQDMYETLSQVVPSLAPMLSPPEARAMVNMLVGSSPMDAGEKKKFREASQQAEQQGPPPDPAVEAAKAKAQIDAQSAQQQMELKQQQSANDLQMKQVTTAADIQMQREKTAAEIEAIRLKNEAQLEIEREKTNMTLYTKGQEHDMNIKLMDHKADVEGRPKRDEFKGAMDRRDNQISQVTETLTGVLNEAKQVKTALDEIMAELSAPSEIVRGRDGKPIGVKKGNRTRAISRGADGSIAGLQ